MVEVPCTLRCDGCGAVKVIVMEMKLTFPERLGPATLTPLAGAIPADWSTASDELRCPRCNGVK